MTDYPNPGTPIDPADHPETNMPASDYWADKSPSERPFKGTQKTNLNLEPNPHTEDPWNKSFTPGNQ